MTISRAAVLSLVLVGVGASGALAAPGTTVVAATNDDAPGVAGGKFKSFGSPAIDAAGRMTFRAQLQLKQGGITQADSVGIWTQDAGGALRLVARQGDDADGTIGQFANFGDPVAGGGRVAFVATIRGAAGATGIWSDASGVLTVVARQGDFAPGASGGKFAKFLAIGLPDEGGPVILATLSGSVRPGTVGVWRADAFGRLDALVATGERVLVGLGAKNVATLEFMPAVKGVNGQTRGFDRVGSVTLRATFTDGTQGILTFGSRARAVPFTVFAPSKWQSSDAFVGVAGYAVEDFESPALVPGLEVALSGGSADFASTNVLPRAFDPVADDPNAGDLFESSLWDGSHVLLNRTSAPLPVGYVDGEWADVTFNFPGGASSVGFSLGQVDFGATPVSVVRTSGTTGHVLSDLMAPGSRNGYVRFDTSPGDSILSIKIDNQSGDGFAVDHLAFHAPIADPSAPSMAVSGDVAPGAGGARFGEVGPPVIADSARVAFRGKLLRVGGVTSADASGVWAENAAGLALVARQGDAAPGTTGAFRVLGDPVNRTDGSVAFLGTLAPGGGITKATAVGVWSDMLGALSLVARQGDQAPGAAAGVTFASFPSLGLTDRGVVVLATVKGRGVTKANGTGIWADDGTGALVPALRLGDQVTAGGAPRVVKKIDFLPKLPVVGAQTRSFDAAGDLAVHATFADRTEALLRIVP